VLPYRDTGRYEWHCWLPQRRLSSPWAVGGGCSAWNYTLQEHQTAAANQGPTSNSNGSVSTDLTGLGLQTWEQDQGFLVMATTDGSVFYRPRSVSANAILLVQTDVLARNGVLVSITSQPSGKPLLVRQ